MLPIEQFYRNARNLTTREVKLVRAERRLATRNWIIWRDDCSVYVGRPQDGGHEIHRLKQSI